MAVVKGAFIRYDNDQPVVVVFQFNPESISRTPAHPPLESATPTLENPRITPSEPAESMRFDLQIDATDQLAAGSPLAAAHGILPILSALELLMIPTERPNLQAMSGDNAYTSPPRSVPLVLFFWGTYRILPVRITNLGIDETRFDTRLNPVRAKVSVSLDVLTPNRLGDNVFGKGVYDYTRGVKQVMAALNTLNALETGAPASLSLNI